MGQLDRATDMIDIGVNLTHASFRADLAQVVERAHGAGVSGLVLTGTSVPGSVAAAKLCRELGEGFHSTAGVHPHDASGCDGHTLDALNELAGRPEVVAIGECGLDYNRDFSPRDVQRRWFAEQLDLAAQVRLPVFLHDREAHADFAKILGARRQDLPGAVVHCFTGTEEELDSYLQMDCHIGVTGWICDERRGQELRRLVRRIPLDRLMIETDAPFLMPRTIRPRPKTRRNEPANLIAVANKLAECLGRPESEVRERTTETARRFFGIS